MGGGEVRHIYAKIETNFLEDARVRLLTGPQFKAYLAVWLMAVEYQTATLSLENSSITHIGRRANVNQNAVKRMLNTCQTGDKPLLNVDQNGRVTVCGVTKLHPTLFLNDVAHKRREEKRREEKEEEAKDPPSLSSKAREATAAEKLPQEFSTASAPHQHGISSPRPPEQTELLKIRLPWQENLPWFKQLFRFELIPQSDHFASKICDMCIKDKGISWNHLQEKLMDASAYLEAHKAKYKAPGTRAFYWHQAEMFKNSVPPDPKLSRAPETLERKWPPGATRYQDGKFFSASGAIVALDKNPECAIPSPSEGGSWLKSKSV
jgi:hypothetical protein